MDTKLCFWIILCIHCCYGYEAEILSTNSIVYATEDRALNLTCRINRTKTYDIILFFKNEQDSSKDLFVFDGTICYPKTHFICDYTNQLFTYTLEAGSFVNGDYWRCRADTMGIISEKVTITVVEIFSLITMTEPIGNIITIDVNLSGDFKCETSLGRPDAEILWYKRLVNGTEIQLLNGSSSKVMHNGTKSWTKSTLQYTAVESENGANIWCEGLLSQVLNNIPQKSREIQLNIRYVPDTNPRILQTPPGGILTGNVVKLTCSVPGGNPLAILSWNCTGTKGNNTTGNTASYSITLSVDKSYNNKICRCTADHVISTYKPTVQQNLVVYYAPDDLPSIQQTPPGGIITGGTVTLTCLVKGGNPPAILRWNCTGDTTNRTTDPTAIYSVSFTVNKHHNNAICTCSASHPVTSYIPVIDHRLDVYYVPDTNPLILQTPSGGIITGNVVKLTCFVPGGNPLAILSWNCTGTKGNNTAGNTASYSITLSVDKSYNNKICRCTADHVISTYKPTVQHNLVVYYAPDALPSIQQTPPGGIITGRNVTLTCSVKGGNPPAILRWNCTGDTTNRTTDTTSIYSVSFTVDKNHNNAICTCSALHPVTSYIPVIDHRLDVYFEPFLDTTRYNTPTNITISENDNLFITVSVTSNPHPIIKWTFLAQANMDCYNNRVINSTSLNVGLHSSSNISIDDLKKNEFGQYTFMATNDVGIFLRKFSVLGKVYTGEDVLALQEDNRIMFSAGIASLVIGLLFFVAAIIFIFRKRFRKTYTKSSKSNEYSDLQTCNPAFQDPYTSIQNPIESSHQQESSANTYEECGNASDAAAYQNIEHMKSGHKKAEKKMGIYDNMKI